MAKHPRGKKFDVRTTATRVIESKERRTGQPASAALKLLARPGSSIRQTVEAGRALLKGRKLRHKSSPGATLEIKGPAWPTGEGKLNQKTPADMKDSTATPVEPTIR